MQSTQPEIEIKVTYDEREGHIIHITAKGVALVHSHGIVANERKRGARCNAPKRPSRRAPL